MTRYRLGLAASTAFLFLSPTLASAAPDVVVSIKPVHSLVASIMKGVGEPSLIVEGAASPHTYSLKPSNARALENADLVFWVGPGLEAFLEKPLEALPKNAKVVELEDAPGITKLPFREGGAFEGHDHDANEEEGHAHGHDDHGHEETAAEAGHDHDHGHGHDHGHEQEAAEAGHEHEHDDHAHGGMDMHLWLDPTNAKAMATEITKSLVDVDPSNKATYEANLTAVSAEIDALDTEIAAQLKPVLEKPFIVFHDAYQYFEKHYGVRVAGSVTVSPETMPGAERLSTIHAKIEELGAACVFAEPQFEPKLIGVVTEGTEAKSGVLDPEGGALEAGPALYGQLMRNLATSISTCLSQ
ncbi:MULTISPECIES: zinc ABC transporter substrate-binding protein ZnuA [Rhizobium/Agrobacterium group]|uniref:zinc ABC transporter substrate-binding protein ZnuA n=1 Tax=Rhizobium sp. AAP116 TaxID=1523429 RepID=UPI000B0C99DF|nr:MULTISPECIES: zinc ABC transporter substrate-binding protein ZnuA [Rhizobium/Agrobacterium group]QGG90466.1 zinc ABC transporter substrate-binding protein ZnuA [Agrobacterium sp. MA01]